MITNNRCQPNRQRYRLEEIYRDAKILEIFEGANEVLQWVIVRQLIGRDVTG